MLIQVACKLYPFAQIFWLLYILLTGLVVWWSELLATNHEVPGSIPGSAMGIFLVGREDPRGDRGLAS